VIVCGGRNYTDRDHISNTLLSLDKKEGPFDCIIHGCATGADREGMIWAQTMGILHAPFQADWRAHRKIAGLLRNQRMIDEGRPDLVIAFPGGNGTADMVKRAKRAGLKVIEVKAK